VAWKIQYCEITRDCFGRRVLGPPWKDLSWGGRGVGMIPLHVRANRFETKEAALAWMPCSTRRHGFRVVEIGGDRCSRSSSQQEPQTDDSITETGRRQIQGSTLD